MTREQFTETLWKKGDKVTTRYGGKNTEMTVRRIDFDYDMILVQSPTGDTKWCMPQDICSHNRKES